jgi:hypothetical protein
MEISELNRMIQRLQGEISHVKKQVRQGLYDEGEKERLRNSNLVYINLNLLHLNRMQGCNSFWSALRYILKL